MIVFTAFYYTVFCSAVLLYGIGLNGMIAFGDSSRPILLPFVKMVLSVVCSAVLSWLIVRHLLVPLNLAALYPLVALFVFASISVFLETLIRITSGRTTAEFCISYLVVVLSLNESVRIQDVLLISVCCFLSFLLLIPVLNAVKKRIDSAGGRCLHGNRRSLLLISIAAVVLALSAADNSWLNPGVLP
ncbi:MAG: hypothetical protein K2H09_01255 [Treponemataceae bacterium]|nr:hypothetical protein [Treponemataceae bacterium]